MMAIREWSPVEGLDWDWQVSKTGQYRHHESVRLQTDKLTEINARAKKLKLIEAAIEIETSEGYGGGVIVEMYLTGWRPVTKEEVDKEIAKRKALQKKQEAEARRRQEAEVKRLRQERPDLFEEK